MIGSGVRAMYSDSHGNLWLGAFREEVLKVGRDSAQRFAVSEGVPHGQFTAFAEDREGAIWLAFGGHICLVNGNRLTEVEIPDRVGSGGRASLVRDVEGRVWCALNGRVGLLHGGKFEQKFRLESRDVIIAAARTDGLWVCAGSRVYRIAGGAPPVERIALPAAIRALTLLEDSAGALWIGTGSDGLFRYDGRRLESVETSHRNVGTLLEDREGNIWAGTFGGGLNRLRPRAMELIGTQSGLPFESVVSLCQDPDGMFWVVADSGQLACGKNSSWSIRPAGGGAAACVVADGTAKVWVGTRGYGLREIDRRTGSVRTWDQDNGLPSNSVRAVLIAADNSVWFTTNGAVSLCRLRDGIVRRWAVPETVRNIRALVQDARGTIWIGTSDGQVLKVIGDMLVVEPALAGAVSTSVRCLQAPPDGSLWVGYAERGVGILKEGRYTRLASAEGLVDDSIWQIGSDRAGAVWLVGPHGLCKVELEDAMAVVDGRKTKLRSTLYGYEQGLPNLQPHYGNAPAVCPTSDGRVLFSTSLGVLALSPQNLRGNAVPPPVTLERVTLD
ncbi:MAG: two-component regulator propeller domain-containing protein, partial [Phycisphaerales bacterium]|nr:two-component regulator propeller domain-containing protein [Phycisphaerales bacterium]